MSEWLQWVPEAAIVVAIVAAAAAYVFREFEAGRARKRELKGLLRLLAVEIDYNEHLLEFLEKNPNDITKLAEGAGVHTRAWEENRGRIAQLIKHSEDLQDLADYFMNVAVFETERRAGRVGEESLAQHIPMLRGQGMDALEAVIKVVGAKVEPQVDSPLLEAPKNDG